MNWDGTWSLRCHKTVRHIMWSDLMWLWVPSSNNKCLTQVILLIPWLYTCESLLFPLSLFFLIPIHCLILLYTIVHCWYLLFRLWNVGTPTPHKYHKFSDIFSGEKADILALHCPYNLKINLEEGTKPSYGLIYSLSPTELTVLREFIDEHVHNGFIRPTRSPWGSPVLFVKDRKSVV